MNGESGESMEEEDEEGFTCPVVLEFFKLLLGCMPALDKKGSPYSITKHRVAELIPVLGSQPGCHYFLPGPQLPPQLLRGQLPILLLGKQRHDGCEQFA